MKNFTARTRSGEKINLFSNDTFTLAIGSPDTEFTETTPELLFESFDSVALADLIMQVVPHSDEETKLLKAWALFDAAYATDTLPS